MVAIEGKTARNRGHGGWPTQFKPQIGADKRERRLTAGQNPGFDNLPEGARACHSPRGTGARIRQAPLQKPHF
jgi:hypothetical protein